MAIAGSNVEAVKMQVIDGRLIEGAITRIPSTMAKDAHEAIAALLEGEAVYVHWYGLNYVSVRGSMRKRGVEVNE